MHLLRVQVYRGWWTATTIVMPELDAMDRSDLSISNPESESSPDVGSSTSSITGERTSSMAMLTRLRTAEPRLFFLSRNVLGGGMAYGRMPDGRRPDPQLGNLNV